MVVKAEPCTISDNPVAGLVPWAFGPRTRSVGTRAFHPILRGGKGVWIAGTRPAMGVKRCVYGVEPPTCFQPESEPESSGLIPTEAGRNCYEPTKKYRDLDPIAAGIDVAPRIDPVTGSAVTARKTGAAGEA
jgi:hypothetical protein